ncbi:regulatory protein GemA [Oscillospiraceae bacterium OttesenSCG-928-F05]|nr:regulatory protein GemA [Oscillospiraceae bacterium OttesenSCG-928-F05]
MAVPRRQGCSIRTIWGLAKSQELRLDENDLYALIFRETGKSHMSDLSQGEINDVCRVLGNMKDDTKRTVPQQRRTDEGGRANTVALRHKIYALTGELGWNGNNARINGFVKKVTGIERIEWLNRSQCAKVIEGLKKMVARRKEAASEIQ